MKLIKVFLRKVNLIPRKIVSFKEKRQSKKFKGIVLCGNTLHDISEEADISIKGTMLFNYKAFNSKSREYEIGRITIEKKAKLICGSGVSFHAGNKLAVHDGAELVLGNNIFFNLNTTLYCRKKVIIGRYP